jgi:amidase
MTAMQDTVGAFLPDGLFVVDGAGEGPLSSHTFAAKDIIDVAGRLTGCGNPDWARTHAAADAHAPVVQALLDAGARLVGKTITDELAFSLNGQNAHYGTPANANAPGRICGGSSCGSASAVAAGLVDFALGSDTGGSVRVPSSYCGLFGLRPTHGRVSLAGVMPLAPSFDTLGWMTRDAALLGRVGEVLFGARAGAAFVPGELLLADDAFALLDEGLAEGLAPWLGRLEARLGPARRVQAGGPEGLVAWKDRFRALQAREIWATHGAWIEEVRPSFGPDVAERFAWVQTIPQAEAAEAAEAREVLRARLDALLGEDRLLCLPSAPGIAPLVDASPEDLRRHRDRVLSLTCIAGLSGLPQVSLPLGRGSGCPLGLSLMGPRGSDLGLLAFAESLCGDLS